MKKILSLILILVSINSFSQTGFPMTQSMATVNTKLQVNGGLQATMGLINGVFADTTAANASPIDFYDGAQIWTTSDRNFWLRSTVLNMWIRMAKFSEVSGATPGIDDVLAVGQSFTTNREINLANSRLTFKSTLLPDGIGAIDSIGRLRMTGYETLIPSIATFSSGSIISNKLFIGNSDNAGLFIARQSVGVNALIQTYQQLSSVGTSGLDINVTFGGGQRQGLTINSSQQGIIYKIWEYNTNQGSSYTARTLVDKNYVDSSITAGGGGSESTTVTNLPGDGVGVFKQLTGSDIELKRLKAGDGIAITDMTDSILITSVIDINNNDEWYPYKADMGNPTQAFLWRNASGVGAATNTLGDVFLNWFNSATYQTGTTSSGLAYTHHGNNSLVQPISIVSTARYSFRVKLRLEDLSDGTETYKIWAGYADDHTNGNPVDAFFFTYTHSDSSGQFVCKVVNNSSVTAVASGVTVAADTDYILETTAIAGIAYFYINKTLVATIGGVPDDDLARVTSINLAIRKSNGTTSRKMYIEEVWYGRKSN